MTTPDIIDTLVGIAPGSRLDRIRAGRLQARENAQNSYLALFAPAAPDGLSPGERFAVVSTARRISGYRVGGSDTLEGALRICSPQTRSCEPPVEVPGVRDLVVPGATSILG